ncbi:hypothetical protein M408DRAFT_102075 [Serendipita vermifera MAFF 305830]|uniref:Uncharacterized protein n=1 Tax=Serendipita vermifera MAFF 305830 TaxID=933852 RepID=A0A0C3AAI8_SERVB|nr:hypothetical protein M408DRAFT_102075 [Serendipita vermifera MAFF 305830]
MSNKQGLKVRPRPRAGSFQEALEEIENDPKHHIAGSMAVQSPMTSLAGSPPPMFPTRKRPQPSFWKDIVSMKWMIRPCQCPIYGCPFSQATLFTPTPPTHF